MSDLVVNEAQCQNGHPIANCSCEAPLSNAGKATHRAAEATAALQDRRTAKHAAAALASEAGGDSRAAAEAHRRAAAEHDKGYGQAVMDGDDESVFAHQAAAALHRKAAEYHDDQEPDEDEESPENVEAEMTDNADYSDPDLLDVPTINFGEPSFDRTGPVHPGWIQKGRAESGGTPPDVFAIPQRVVRSASELFADDEELPDEDRESRLALSNPPCQGSSSPIDPRYHSRGPVPGNFPPKEGLGRAGNYDLNQASSWTTPVVNRDGGITVDEGLPLPSEYL
jgi:hypothetical protein